MGDDRHPAAAELGGELPGDDAEHLDAPGGGDLAHRRRGDAVAGDPELGAAIARSGAERQLPWRTRPGSG
ncbi:MAG: hypothetical protein U0R26_10605 [Solirubrobacterales bacterium]